MGGTDNNYNSVLVQGDKKSFSVPVVGTSCSCVGFEGKKKNCGVIVNTTSKNWLLKSYAINLSVDCVSNAISVNPSALVIPISQSLKLSFGENCSSVS